MKPARYSPATAGTSLGSVMFGNVCWIHWFPNAVAFTVPLKGDTVCGARRRKSPTLEERHDVSDGGD